MTLAVFGITVEDLLPEEPPVDPSRLTPGLLGFASFWFIIAVAGLVVLAVVIAVIVLVRRTSPKAVPLEPASLPPGWYPVPDGTGRVAWWDGKQWTDGAPPNT